MSTTLIISGGPSLKNFDVGALPIEEFEAVIAVTNSWKLAPWADVLHFGDYKFWERHGDEILHDFRGRITTVLNEGEETYHPRVDGWLRNTTGFEAVEGGRRLYGVDSTTQALSLAYHITNSTRYAVAGADYSVGAGGETNWHGDYPSTVEKHGDTWLEGFNIAVHVLSKGCGVEVASLTPTRANIPVVTPDSLFKRG